jgi:hypothetical protein
MSQSVSSLPNEAFDCFREDLLVYLTQRFGSLRLANQILNETRRQLGDNSVLSMVGNPAVYLMGFAVSVGLNMTGSMTEHGDKHVVD